MALKTVLIVIVTYNNSRHIDSCLDSIASDNCLLNIVVFDNYSSDESAVFARRHASRPRVFTNSRNDGFARAVNQASSLASFDYLLMLNPDTVLEIGAIDRLLQVAQRWPNAGLYGGTWTDNSGKHRTASVLPKPNLLHALRFALCVDFLKRAAGRQLPLAKRLSTRATRAVPALEGSLLMVSAPAWRRLGGFDESFFLYGEDVDLCMRARKIGLLPICSKDVRFFHERGASSPSKKHRQKAVLKAMTVLHRRYSAGWLCDPLLLFGVFLRARMERLFRSSQLWQQCWRERADWFEPKTDI